MVTQRLANIQDYRLQRTIATPPEQQPIWEETVKAELNAEQNNAWQGELRQRESYRESAIAAALLDAFQRKIHLNKSQEEKIEALLGKILADYGEDIRGMFRVQWGGTCSGTTCFFPLPAYQKRR
jgi:hypothetical protein